MKICSVDGCGKSLEGWGYCSKHYSQIRNHGKIIDEELRLKREYYKNKKCSVVGCNRHHICNTYCAKHNAQFKKYGKIMDDEYAKTRSTFCIVDGCNNLNPKNKKGYCYKHYTQLRKHGKLLERTKYNPNKIILYDNHAEIELYNHKAEPIAYAKIDLEDVEKVKEYKWCLSGNYPITTKQENRNKSIKICNILLNFKGNRKEVIDHIDHNPLNNCRNNLRIVSQTENVRSGSLWKKNTSGYKGVCWDKKNKKWRARLSINGHERSLGYFLKKEDAIKSRKNIEISMRYEPDSFKILLIQPPSNILANRYEGKPALMPLNLMFLSGTLRANGYNNIKLMDCMAEGYYTEKPFYKGGEFIRYGLSEDIIKQKIKEYDPTIIGISVMCDVRRYHAVEVAKLAKEVCPHAIVCLGGNPCTVDPNWFLDKEGVTYVVVGEGEQPFLKLVQYYESIKNPHFKGKLINRYKIDGLCFKDYMGKIIINPQTYWEKDLDKIPFPDNSIINHQLYLDIWKKEGYQTFEARKFTMSVMARGCPNFCKHCCHDVIFPGYRVRSAKNLFAEVKEVHEKYGICQIDYHEYNGLVSWTIVKEFCELMIESGLNKKVRWGWPIGIWLKALNYERLKLMREAGMDYVCLAIESYDQKKLDETMPGKDVDLKHTLNVIKWCRELNYQMHAFFMLGLQGQNKQDIENTISFAKSLDIDTASFFIAQPLPGSAFHEFILKNKLFIKGFNKFHLRYGKSNHYVSKDLTPKILENYRHEARKQFIESRGNSYQKIKEQKVINCEG